MGKGRERGGRERPGEMALAYPFPSSVNIFLRVFPTSENPNAGNSAQCSGKTGMCLVCWTSII